MKSITYLFLAVGMASMRVSAQTAVDSVDLGIMETYESVLEYSTQDVEDLQYAETLFQLYSERVDLSRATTEDLLRIPSIDPVLAARIVFYRDSLHIQRVRDLLNVEGIDGNVYKQIRGYLRVGEGARKSSGVHFTSRTSRGIQERQGYKDGTYPGSQYKIYNRLIVRSGVGESLEIEAGGLTEKDPGERALTDFTTGYLHFQSRSAGLRCILGSYVVEAGQGLVFWRSSGPTKGSEVISSVSKNPRGIQPSASADENGLLQGIAVQSTLEWFEVTALYSNKNVNASLDNAGNISSFDASGLFRTPAELKKRSASKEKIIGLSSNIRIREGVRVGIHGYRTEFGNALNLSGVNGIRGRSAWIAGADYALTAENAAAYGELAVDKERNTAYVGGIVIEPVPALTVSVGVRLYPTSFVSLHGFGFGESGSRLQNERGVYAAARVHICSWLAMSGYYDQFLFPGPTNISPLPTSGHEALMSVDVTPKTSIGIQFQLKQRTRSDKQDVLDQFSRTVSHIGTRNQFNWRATLEWWPSSSIRWKSRLEQVLVDYSIAGAPSKGALFFQDVRVKATKEMSLDARVVVFDTESYDSRLYEFEGDLRGAFSNPALTGRGNRFYVVLRYEYGVIEFSGKYATTIIPGVRTLGSGPNELNGDLDNQFSVQMEVKW